MRQRPNYREILSSAEKAAAKEIFEGELENRSACVYCAGIHAHVAKLDAYWQPCPRIRRIERHPDGSILVLEFWPNGDWEQEVIFPDDVYEDEEVEE